MQTYRDLIVWQKSLELVEIIYATTQDLPETEKFGLTNQMRRAAVSIPSNIAEGHERQSTKDFAHFLTIARGSAAELETQIIISAKLQFIKRQKTEELLTKTSEIKKMLFSLRKKLQTK